MPTRCSFRPLRHGRIRRCWPDAPSARTTNGRSFRRRLQYRFAEATAQAQSLADAPWFQVFDDPTLQALIRDAIANNLDLRVAAGARRRGTRPCRNRQVVPLSRRSMARPRTACGGRRRRKKNNDTTHQSGTYGFHLSWEIDLFGRLRRGQEAAIALALATEQGRRGVLVTLVGDVASNYFLLRELDLQLEIAPTDASPQRRDRHVFSEPPEWRRVQSSRTRPDSGPPRADGGCDPGNRTPDRPGRKPDLAAPWTSARRRSPVSS